MLALCVREENLMDPGRWCRQMREYMRQSSSESLCAADTERLMQWSAQLALAAAGESRDSIELDNVMPEVAAFNAYEAAVKQFKNESLGSSH